MQTATGYSLEHVDLCAAELRLTENKNRSTFSCLVTMLSVQLVVDMQPLYYVLTF